MFARMTKMLMNSGVSEWLWFAALFVDSPTESERTVWRIKYATVHYYGLDMGPKMTVR
jgi:hypothetical protein